MADFDAVVVGAGAGGGVAAYVLAARGWKVALVEKGRNPYPTLGDPVLSGSLFGNDELRTRRFYAYQDPFIEPRVYRRGESAAASRTEMQGLGVCLGGGTVQYDGDSPRVQQTCLRLRSTIGDVEGASVVDWPISYDDLAPYYDVTEQAIGIQGEAGADPFAEPRSGPYPMPPGYPPKAGLILATGARALGYHPHPMPMAVNSIYYRGRPACVNCGFCRHGCPINAKGSTAVTAVRDALATGNLTLLCECCVTGVETEPSGERATGVRSIDPRGATQTVTARHVVLACNAIETPRLMLDSTSSAHPDGLGNASGLVGRYLMMHLIFVSIGVFGEEIRSYRGRVVTHALADFTVPTGEPGWLRGGYVELGGQEGIISQGVSYPWMLHRELMGDGRYFRRIAGVSMMGEDLPQLANRVDLDPTVHDVYGRAAARITYARHPHDDEMIDYYFPKLTEIARTAGAQQVMPIDMTEQLGAPDSKHLLGTTRMGTDPALSVCDRWGRLHDVENVWIADGGIFPTSTAFNPTLTQQALAWRTAAFMADPEDPRP